MDKLEKVIDHFEECMEIAESTPHEWIMVRVEVLREALELLKAQEQRKRLEVHNIGNVDIPEGVTTDQFYAVMNNVVKALEHTDRGESWPYEEDDEE